MARMRSIDIDVEVHRAVEGARKSFSETENDILRRLLLNRDAKSPQITATIAPALAPSATKASRSRGNWSVRLHDQRLAAPNLKDAYRTLLIRLAEMQPNFLTLFAQEGARSRRFIARTPEQLYSNSPHLARDHAKPLIDGWFFDTNLSAEQVSQRARVAARLAGLNYGRDVQILDNFREI